MRRLIPSLLICAATVASCTLSPLPTPTPTRSPSPSPSPTPSPTPVPTPTPTPDATLDPASIPGFATGEIVATAIDGMRLRRQPGTDGLVIAGLLPLGTELQVIMGPVPVEDLGWYLVADADPDEPDFDDGWIAAGYEPDPFVAAAGRGVPPDSPYVGGLAATGNAEQGPITIPDEHHAIRWLALDPEGRGCVFRVSLTPPGGMPVPTIRATIGAAIVPGILQPTFFAGQPTLRGDLFLGVESDCTWALAMLRVPPEPPAEGTPLPEQEPPPAP